MTAWLLALTLGAAAPRALFEAALVVPRMGDLVLHGVTVLHDAPAGVTLLPGLTDEDVESFFDGTSGRFVVSGRAVVGAEARHVRLPLAEGELQYYALRDGRPGRREILDPSAITISVTATPTDHGMRLDLRIATVQLAARQPTEPLGDRPVGEPVFEGRTVELPWTLLYGEPLLVLIEPESAAGRRALEQTVRQRIGNQTFETCAPPIGVMLRIAPEDAEPAWEHVTPPVAPPGEIRILGEVGEPGLFPFQPGLMASQVYDLAGRGGRPGPLRLRLSRLGDAGVEQFELEAVPAAGGAQDFALLPRDQLIVGRATAQVADLTSGQAPVLPGPAGPPGLRGPAGAQPAPAERGATDVRPSEAESIVDRPANLLVRRMPLEEWRRVAPSAARAADATVAIVARKPVEGGERTVQMAGIAARADGTVITCPASALDGASSIHVLLPDGRELPAEPVGRDASGSLLALRVEAGDLAAITVSDAPPQLGEAVVVVGHPYGLDRSVSLGIIGGLDRRIAGAAGATVQLDLALAAGNSGGPVVDLEGRLVALAYGTVQPGEEGPPISLAVPASAVAAFLRSLR